MKGRINAGERLIVALDLESVDEARQMVEKLHGLVDFFKIGLTLQLAGGVEKLISDVIQSRKRVFLNTWGSDSCHVLPDSSWGRWAQSAASRTIVLAKRRRRMHSVSWNGNHPFYPEHYAIQTSFLRHS